MVTSLSYYREAAPELTSTQEMEAQP